MKKLLKLLKLLILIGILIPVSGQAQETKPGWYGIIGISGAMHSFHDYAATFKTDEGLLTNTYPSSRFALIGHIGGWKQVYNTWGVQARGGYAFLYGDDTRKSISGQLGVTYDLTNLTERQSPVRFLLTGGIAYTHIFKSVEGTRGNGIGPFAGVVLQMSNWGVFGEYSPQMNTHSDRLNAYVFGFSYYVGSLTRGNKSVF